ncbi:MAG: AtpZ/AtpI family protein [Phycisphaerae bacterium]
MKGLPPSQNDDEDAKARMQWMRVGASAFNLVAMILVLGYVGHRLDLRLGWSPWGTLGGLLLGMIGGLWTVIKESEKINR